MFSGNLPISFVGFNVFEVCPGIEIWTGGKNVVEPLWFFVNGPLWDPVELGDEHFVKLVQPLGHIIQPRFDELDIRFDEGVASIFQKARDCVFENKGWVGEQGCKFSIFKKSGIRL